MEPIYRTFKSRRVRRRNAGIALIVIGLALAIAFTRARSSAALAIGLGTGIGLHIIGWVLFAGAYSTPTREVLVLAKERRAALTPADLVTEMDLDLPNARAVLDELTRVGLLRKADNAEAYLLAGDTPRPPTKMQ